MFINKLIYFHKNKLSQYNMIFKHIKVQLITFLIFILFSSVSIVVLLLISEFEWLPVPILIYIISIYSFNNSIKRIIKKIHKNDINSILSWNGWIDYKIRLMKIFLEKNSHINKDSIKNYIDFIEKEAIKSKPTFYFIIGIPGLILALFIPVWNQFNSWMYTNILNSLEWGIIYIVLLVIILFLIGFIASTIKLLASDILESKYRKLNELAYILELVIVSLDEPIIDKTIIERLN